MVTSIMIWPNWPGQSICCLIYRQDLREAERTEKEMKIYNVFPPHFSVDLMQIWQNIYIPILITSDLLWDNPN